MTTKIPEIIDILHACKSAYHSGRGAVGKPKLTKKPCPYSKRIRKGPTKRVIEFILKDGDLNVHLVLDQSVRKMLINAFDIGLCHQQEEEEVE